MELTIDPVYKTFWLGDASPALFLSAVDCAEVRETIPVLSKGISPDTVWHHVPLDAVHNRRTGSPNGHPREADDDSIV